MRPSTRQLISHEFDIGEALAFALDQPRDHHGDHAKIAEPVGEPRLQGDDARIRLERRHLGLGVAPGGEIELVRLVDQLSDAAPAAGVERLGRKAHLQGGEIIADVTDAGPHLGALGVAGVGGGARPIVGGEGDGLEVAGGGQQAREPRGIVGKLGDRHYRQGRAGGGALGGIVVQEHEGVQADVQRLGDRFQIARLVAPVGLEYGDVGELQSHLRMAGESAARHGVVVLGGHRQDHAAALQIERQVLDGEERLTARAALAQGQVLHAVIADHPAPQGIVEIEHQGLARLSARRAEQPSHPVGVKAGQLAGERQLVGEVAHRIEPALGSHRLGQGGDVQHQRPASIGERQDARVRLGDQPPARAGDATVEGAEQGFGRNGQGAEDRHAAGVGDETVEQRLQAFARRRKLRGGVVEHRPIQPEPAVIERQQHRVGAGARRFRSGIERLLHGLVIRRQDEIESDAVPRRRRRQMVGDEIEGGVAQGDQP